MNLLTPTFDQLLAAHLDITKPEQPVEVKVDGSGVLWVNVGPVCVLRICRTNEVVVEAPDGVVLRQPLMNDVLLRTAAKIVLDQALEVAGEQCHPCDRDNYAVRAKHLSQEMRQLYNAMENLA